MFVLSTLAAAVMKSPISNVKPGKPKKKNIAPAWDRAYPHATTTRPCTSSLAVVVRASTSASSSSGRLCNSRTRGGWLSASSAGGGWASALEPVAGPAAHPPVAGRVPPPSPLPKPAPPPLPGPALSCLQPWLAQHSRHRDRWPAQCLRRRQPQPGPPRNVEVTEVER
ncbi:UNVERIFIED_CONTAM: hypothetical protein K2H54_013317 [Gekko kuhli]